MGAFDGAIIESRVKTIIKAIEKQDAEMITDLFSRTVINEVGIDKIQEGAAYLLTVLEGNVLSIEDFSVVTNKEFEGGKGRRFYKQVYYITTDVDVYWVSFIYYTKDSITPEKRGMHQLAISNLAYKIYSYLRSDFIGIYVPPESSEAERDIPHEYETSFGFFSIPAGYYKEASQSVDEKFYFSVGNVDLSAVNYEYFSLSLRESDNKLDDMEGFRNKNIANLNDLVKGDGVKYGSDCRVEETYFGETKQGYPLQVLSIIRNTTLLEKHYFIMADQKYILVHYKRFPISNALDDDEQAMLDAVESVVNSFVWAE